MTGPFCVVFSPLTVIEGVGPEGPGQFAIDTTTADREDLVVGGTYDIIGVDGREPFELVGITRFGEENALAGAVLMSLSLDELQRLAQVLNRAAVYAQGFVLGAATTARSAA